MRKREAGSTLRVTWYLGPSSSLLPECGSCSFSLQNNADQVAFQVGGGLSALEQILLVVTAASTPTAVPRIPIKWVPAFTVKYSSPPLQAHCLLILFIHIRGFYTNYVVAACGSAGVMTICQLSVTSAETAMRKCTFQLPRCFWIERPCSTYNTTSLIHWNGNVVFLLCSFPPLTPHIHPQ